MQARFKNVLYIPLRGFICLCSHRSAVQAGKCLMWAPARPCPVQVRHRAARKGGFGACPRRCVSAGVCHRRHLEPAVSKGIEELCTRALDVVHDGLVVARVELQCVVDGREVSVPAPQVRPRTDSGRRTLEMSSSHADFVRDLSPVMSLMSLTLDSHSV